MSFPVKLLRGALLGSCFIYAIPGMVHGGTLEELIGLNESRQSVGDCVHFKVSASRRLLDDTGGVQDHVESEATVIACGSHARCDSESRVLESRRGSVPTGRVTHFASPDSVAEWFRDSMGMTEYMIGSSGNSQWALMQLRDLWVPRPDLAATHLAFLTTPQLFPAPTVPLRTFVESATANGYTATVVPESSGAESRITLQHPADTTQHRIEITVSNAHHGITAAAMMFADGSPNRTIQVEYGEESGAATMPTVVTVRIYEQGQSQPTLTQSVRASGYRVPTSKEAGSVGLEAVLGGIEGDFSVVRKTSLADPGKTFWVVDGALVEDTRQLITATESQP